MGSEEKFVYEALHTAAPSGSQWQWQKSLFHFLTWVHVNDSIWQCSHVLCWYIVMKQSFNCPFHSINPVLVFSPCICWRTGCYHSSYRTLHRIDTFKQNVKCSHSLLLFWTGWAGPIPWPLRFPDLNPLDFFLWVYVKECVCIPPLPELLLKWSWRNTSVMP